MFSKLGGLTPFLAPLLPAPLDAALGELSENRTILDMITSGGPARAGTGPVIAVKGVAKPVCPATGPAPFLPQSPGCDRAPRR